MSDLDLNADIEAAVPVALEAIFRHFPDAEDNCEAQDIACEGPDDCAWDIVENILTAAAPLIEAQVRAQIAAEAVASDHDDAHRLLRDFAGGCGDNACPICCGDS